MLFVQELTGRCYVSFAPSPAPPPAPPAQPQPQLQPSGLGLQGEPVARVISSFRILPHLLSDPWFRDRRSPIFQPFPLLLVQPHDLLPPHSRKGKGTPNFPSPCLPQARVQSGTYSPVITLFWQPQ